MLRAAARPAAIDSWARTPNVPSPLGSKVTAPAVAQPRKRTRLVPRRPMLPSNTGASGGPVTTPCSSPRLPPGRPRRSSSIASLSSVRVSTRRKPLTASWPTLAWSIAKVARERLSEGSRSRRPTARGMMLSSGLAPSLAPAMRSRSSQREARLVSTARASRHDAFSSPVMSCGRPSCSNDRARSVSVAPPGSARTAARRSNAASPLSAPSVPSALLRRAAEYRAAAPATARRSAAAP